MTESFISKYSVRLDSTTVKVEADSSVIDYVKNSVYFEKICSVLLDQSLIDDLPKKLGVVHLDCNGVDVLYQDSSVAFKPDLSWELDKKFKKGFEYSFFTLANVPNFMLGFPTKRVKHFVQNCTVAESYLNSLVFFLKDDRKSVKIYYSEYVRDDETNKIVRYEYVISESVTAEDLV